jgi:acetamidase/formamidase
LDGCSSGGRRWERLHDDLVERRADRDRLTHRDEVAQERLDGFLAAREATRDAVPRLGSPLGYTTAASPLMGGADAHRAWPLYIAGGATPVLFEPSPPGRTHTIPSIPGETVELGLFDPARAPIVTIDSGDVVVYPNTLTHFLGRIQPGVTIEEIAQLRRDHPGRGPHSIVGPLAVRGAEPGDALEVRFLRLDPIDYGFNFNNPVDLGTGALPEQFPLGQVRYFEVDRRTMTTPWGPHVRIPLGPFQGTLGVAPPVDEPVSSVPPGPYAGNVDLREQVEGTRLFVPVWKPGALLYTGDSHLAQGDGEVNLTAIESAMREVRIQVILHKGAPLRWPFAETPTHWIPLATDVDLNVAFRTCLQNSVDFLVRAGGLTPLDAYGLCSVAVSFRITQVVDVNQGVHAMIPKDLFVEDLRARMSPVGRGD